MAPDGPETAPKAPEIAPMGAQERPSMLLDGFQTKGWPKMSPRWLRDDPNTAPRGPKMAPMGAR